MNLNFARRIKNFCYVAACLLSVLSFVLAETRTLCLILAVIVTAAGIVVSFGFYRCPSCKRPLPTNERLPKTCPHCGETLR